MKIVFNINVGIDVPSYVQAGEVLDKITHDLEAAIGPKGGYDVSEFRARHRELFADERPMMARPMGAVDAEPDPD